MLQIVGNNGEVQDARILDQCLDTIHFQLIDFRNNDLDLLFTVGPKHNLLRSAGIDPPCQRFDQVLRNDTLAALSSQFFEFFRIQLVNEDGSATEVHTEPGQLGSQNDHAGCDGEQNPAKTCCRSGHPQRLGKKMTEDKWQNQNRQDHEHHEPGLTGYP